MTHGKVIAVRVQEQSAEWFILTLTESRLQLSSSTWTTLTQSHEPPHARFVQYNRLLHWEDLHKVEVLIEALPNTACTCTPDCVTLCDQSRLFCVIISVLS